MASIFKELTSVKTYDSPDGKNCAEKVVHSVKVGALVGSYFSAYEMVGWSQPQSIPLMAGRLLHFTLPAMGAAAVFAGTTCMVGEFRGKDGPLNHAIGGIGAGVVIGAKARCVKTGVGVGLLLAALMSYYKLNRNEGLFFFNKEVGTTHVPYEQPIIYGQKILYKPYKKPDYE